MPRNKVLLDLGPKQLQVVQTHKLPDDSQNVLLVAFSDVFRADSDNNDLKLSGALNALVTVLSSLKHVLGLFFYFRPVNNAGADFVDNLQEN